MLAVLTKGALYSSRYKLSCYRCNDIPVTGPTYHGAEHETHLHPIAGFRASLDVAEYIEILYSLQRPGWP